MAGTTWADLQLIGEGRHRIVFRHGDRFVLKIPKGNEGLHANYLEADRYRHRRIDWLPIALARCRLLPNGWLVMEYADPLPYPEHPEWASYVDCQQVGRTRDGRVVAYDYGP